jgi:hypothetical protein
MKNAIILFGVAFGCVILRVVLVSWVVSSVFEGQKWIDDMVFNDVEFIDEGLAGVFWVSALGGLVFLIVNIWGSKERTVTRLIWCILVIVVFVTAISGIIGPGDVFVL